MQFSGCLSLIGNEKVTSKIDQYKILTENKWRGQRFSGFAVNFTFGLLVMVDDTWFKIQQLKKNV